MAHTLPGRSHAGPREKLASVRPRMASADLDTHASASGVREVAGDAIKHAHGKALTAAGILGLHEAHVGRLVNDGDMKLKQLEQLGPQFLAEFGKGLVEQYGPLAASPKVRAKQRIREARQILDELEQFTELIA